MREILFRGKCVSDGEWIYGDLLQAYHHNGKLCQMQIMGQGVSAESHIVDPATVGQYTGLTDKNGVKIFEGDIVECVSWNEFFSIDGKTMEVMRRKMVVVFHNGAFRMKEDLPTQFSMWDLIYDGDIEVIGNIHDQPSEKED